MTTVDFYAKTFPILYPCLENSTTGNAIMHTYKQMSPILHTGGRKGVGGEEGGLFSSLSECLSNVFITGESNLEENNGQLIRGSFLKKYYLKKIHILVKV